VTARTAETRAVERANQAFYDSIENSDLDGLEAVVLTGPLAESVTVVHPGWPVLRGRHEVMRSYALIMANTEYIQFFLTDVEVAVDGDAALVSCTENILTGGPAEEDGSAGSLVGGLVVATNVFRRSTEGWRLWSHHGSPVLAEDDDEDGDGADGSGTMDDEDGLDGLEGLGGIDEIDGIDGIDDGDGGDGTNGDAGDGGHGGRGDDDTEE
jgi:ketosteroid isomerase-like protein